MSPKKKMNRMKQLNGHYSSKQVHSGHHHLKLECAELMAIQRVPDERRTRKWQFQST
jgi:hypothetical protein